MFQKPNTVPTPDEFFDVALKECSGSETKLLAVVINKTFRWGKLWDFISTSQFKKETNLHHDTIIKGLKSLEEKGWIQSAYICTDCGQIVDEVFLGKKRENGTWKKPPSSRCGGCGSTEMPDKWYAARVKGEDLIEHLKNVYKMSRKRFNDGAPGQVIGKSDKGLSENSAQKVIGKSDIQETNLTGNHHQETGASAVSGKSEQSQDENRDDDDNQPKTDKTNPDSSELLNGNQGITDDSTLRDNPVQDDAELSYYDEIKNHLDKHGLNIPLNKNGSTQQNFLVAKRMYDAGVPVACVLKTIDEVIENAKKSNVGRIGSLKYFEEAVLEKFNDFKSKAQAKQAAEKSAQQAAENAAKMQRKQAELANTNRHIPATLDAATEQYGIQINLIEKGSSEHARK